MSVGCGCAHLSPSTSHLSPPPPYPLSVLFHRLAYGLNQEHVDTISITQRVIQGLFPGVKTTELDTLAAEIAASFTTKVFKGGCMSIATALLNLLAPSSPPF